MSGKVHGIIMGGGRGSRLYPLTKSRCKPAVPLAGKYRLVDIPISNCLNAGINRIFLLTQFKTASLHRHIQQAYQFDRFGGGFVEILAAEQTAESEDDEKWYQGTADAVRQNLELGHFDAQDDDLFVILSGDQLYSMNLREMLAQHRRKGSEVTVAAKAISTTEAKGLGLLRAEADCSIAEFVEKPTDPEVIRQLVFSSDKLSEDGDDKCLASMGIYVFNVGTLRKALASDHTDFGKEIIPGLLGKIPMHAYVFDGYWLDIGTVDSFFKANLALTDSRDGFDFHDASNPIYTHPRNLPVSCVQAAEMDHVVITNGCLLGRSKLKRCVIGLRSVVGNDVELENVVLMGADYFEDEVLRQSNHKGSVPDVGIGDGTVIRDAIIDKNARIGRDVNLSPQGLPDGPLPNGLHVRDGVLVVEKNAVVPNGFSL
jgi:glucose-1-phosphate adenylyltransferase